MSLPYKKNDLTSRYLADKEHEDSTEFQKFRCNLFHGSINQILQPLWEYMETPDIVHYSDGYYQHTIYGIGPYIAVWKCTLFHSWRTSHFVFTFYFIYFVKSH